MTHDNDNATQAMNRTNRAQYLYNEEIPALSKKLDALRKLNSKRLKQLAKYQSIITEAAKTLGDSDNENWRRREVDIVWAEAKTLVGLIYVANSHLSKAKARLDLVNRELEEIIQAQAQAQTTTTDTKES